MHESALQKRLRYFEENIKNRNKDVILNKRN